jgi:hypothetical protein
MPKRDPPPPPRPTKPANDAHSGRVGFDERGQAIWEWSVRTGMFDRNASSQRVRALTDGPVKLELEQTLKGLKTPAEKRAPPAPAPAAGPARTALPRDSGGDPYSRGPSKPSDNIEFNPYERTQRIKKKP